MLKGVWEGEREGRGGGGGIEEDYDNNDLS